MSTAVTDPKLAAMSSAVFRGSACDCSKRLRRVDARGLTEPREPKYGHALGAWIKGGSGALACGWPDRGVGQEVRVVVCGATDAFGACRCVCCGVCRGGVG